MNRNSKFDALQPLDQETGDINVIIDTPKGSRNKYSLDAALSLFVLKGILTEGHSFPYDFGFVPNTLGEDGDPLDVLVLMDEPAFCGCLVVVRPIGVIEAEQTENDGKTVRNDRIIGIATVSKTHEHIHSINELSEILVSQIEHFFISYNDAKGKKFRPIGRYDADKARELIKKGTAAQLSSRKKSGD